MSKEWLSAVHARLSKSCDRLNATAIEVVSLTLLALLAAALLSNGLYWLVFTPEGAADLRGRWFESQWMLAGINPYDVARRSSVSLTVGEYYVGSGYPPWSMGFGFLLAPPFDWITVRVWFSVICVASLIYIAAWAWRSAGPAETRARLLVLASVLAISATAVALRLGQYSILVTAAVLFMALHLERQSPALAPALAGIALGVAMLKPQLGAFFCLIPLVRRKPLVACVGITVVAVSAVCVALAVNENIATLIRSAFLVPTQHHVISIGILDPLRGIGLGQRPLLLAGLVVGGLVTFALLWIYRARSVTVHCCIAATMMSICTYHRRYDFVILAIPLAVLAARAVANRRVCSYIVFFAYGLSLWLPLPERLWSEGVRVLQFILWILGLLHILQAESPSSPNR